MSSSRRACQSKRAGNGGLTVTTPDIPEDWASRLESCAQQQHGRSVEQEALRLIEGGVTDREEIFRRIRQRWNELPLVSPAEAATWIERGGSEP